MNTNNSHITAPIMSINRHRLNIDGRGITTLVGLHGCPLHCRYCLNDKCHSVDGIWRTLSVQELYEQVKCDDLYFRATGGGITFGGGEPALHSAYIEAFRNICGSDWNITLETSLNVEHKHIQQMVDVVDDYIIDIKSLDATIYHNYTRRELSQAVDNLHYLLQEGKSKHILVRVPHIEQYNEASDVDATIGLLREWGIEKIDTFTYLTEIRKENSNRPTRTGKTVCNILKKVRCMIADANAIAYTPTPCTHTTCTNGHCPVCEQELSMITNILSQRDNIII